MTDADGTTHHFTRDADDARKWIAPPGVHLTLRRWATTGDPITDPAWVMTRADGVAYFFDRLGYLIKTEDRNGNHAHLHLREVRPADRRLGLGGDRVHARARCSARSPGTPSAANGWGLQTLVGATGSSASPASSARCG